MPAEGIMAAARASARTDLKISTQDLGKNVAIAPAENQLVVGLGAQRPFDQGVTEAQLPGFAEKAFAIKRVLRVNPRPVTAADCEAIYREAW